MPIKLNRRELLKLASTLIISPPAMRSVRREVDQSYPQGSAQIAFETRVPISLAGVRGPRTVEGHLFLRPGETIRSEVIAPEPLTDVLWRLRLTGESDLDPQLRQAEGGFTKLYRLIDDALDRNTTHHRTCSLALRSRGEGFARRAYWRVLWNSQTPAQEYPLTIWAKKEQVEILSRGKLGLQVEVFRKRPGRHQADISGVADTVYFLDLGGGTSDWREFRLPIRLDQDVACLLFTIAAEQFRGRLWLEDPQFPGSDGINSLPPFAPASFSPSESGAPRNWLGENLSQLEWPEFRMTLNERQFFRGTAFQPVYRWPAWEADVPAKLLKRGSNLLEIQLVSNYHETPGYILRSAEWLGVPNGPIEVIACPKLVEAGKDFTVLVSTRQPNFPVQVQVKPIEPERRSNFAAGLTEFSREEPGLQFLKFRAEGAGSGGTIRFRGGGAERYATVERVVERPEDGVSVGTGDSIYVHQEAESFRRFFAWYLYHQLGNSVGFRPVYEWGGTRFREPGAWREAVRLCEGAGLKYAQIIDGRELPGMGASPTNRMLESPFFLGSQTHEQEACFLYLDWVRWPEDELYWDVFLRYPAHDRCYWSDPLRLGDETMSLVFHNPDLTQDMHEGTKYFLSNIKGIRYLGPRHSGVTTLFKYFFQAGYEYLIAELMYGPHEVILGALRGASLANGQPRYGAHIAVQWSTTPHDDPTAFRRYFLSLATCYLHGVEHIHTEEGLWHMEEGLTAHDRFSAACNGHKEVLQRFFRFVRAHSRRGRMRVSVGFLHGQYDGWTCWDRAKVWGQSAPEMAFAAPEKSWDLLKTFFPRSILAPIYRFPCPHEPLGFFTGTPYGPADIVPIEASTSALIAYRALLLLGWNTADAGQMERLLRYVEGGGQLVLGFPHLSTETRRDRAPAPLLAEQTRKLLGLEIEGLGESSGEFKAIQGRDEACAEAVAGQKLRLGKVRLGEAEVRVSDAAGQPLITERRLGRGRVTYVNGAGFPGEEVLTLLYARLLGQIGAWAAVEEGKRVWVQGSEDVSFAVYDWEAGGGKVQTSTIYLLNVNWWSDTPRSAEANLLWGGAEIPLHITRDRIHVITLSKEWGIWTEDLDTDVLEIGEEAGRAKIRLQGQGETRLTILHRPEGGRSASAKLCARTSRSTLRLEPGFAPGLWQTRLTLNGPDYLEILPCQ